jgi:hypothetical protein
MLNKNQYLYKISCIYSDVIFNNLSQEEKNIIIDRLVWSVKEDTKNTSEKLIAILLIFEAQIKKIISLFYWRFKDKFGYSMEDFLSYVFYISFILINEYVSGRSKFNYYFSKKLHSSVSGLLSKHNIYNKYCSGKFNKPNIQNKKVEETIIEKEDYIRKQELLNKNIEEGNIRNAQIVKCIISGMNKEDISKKFELTQSEYISVVLKLRKDVGDMKYGN